MSSAVSAGDAHRRSAKRGVALALLGVSLAGCSAGSRAMVPTAVPTTASIAPAGVKTATVDFTITVPRAVTQAHMRRPQYISVATGSVSVSVSGGGPPTVVAISPTAPNCSATNGGLACTAAVNAPVGVNQSFTITAYVENNGVGPALSMTTVLATIVAGQANQLQVVLNGIVSSLKIALNPSALKAGTPSSVAVIVNALDLEGYTIVGPGIYVDRNGDPLTVTLSDSDTSGATHLSQTTVTGPSTAITLSYNGSAITNPTITANAPGIPGASPATTLTVGATGTVTEFSDGIGSGAAPSAIAAGPDGNLWFTEQSGGAIGRITPGGAVTEFTLPHNDTRDITQGIAPGADGNMWFTEYYGTVGNITPNGIVTEFSSGITPSSSPYGIAKGPDGNVWFTEYQGSRIARITPSGMATEFALPTLILSGQTSSRFPEGITTGPDGNLWFAEFHADTIGRITPSGTITEFTAGITSGSGPQYIVAGPDNNLWFTEPGNNAVGRITAGGVVTEFTTGISAGAAPFGITAGADGNLWFTEYRGNRIGRITTKGSVTEFPVGSANAQPLGIAAGSDGNLWFAEYGASRIGRILP